MRAIAFFAVVSVATFITNQSQAQDAAAGEKVFTKCKVCHVVDK
ncbi:MAG: cytochrome c family protein, partial [Mesorhizobium sp.]